MPRDYDIAVVGAGLVGLATARALLERHPGARLAVLDKEPEVARHQSGHNSGVIHAGLYYAAGSLKAELCREGRAALLRYAEEKGIPHRVCGKLVVAVEESELPRLEELRRRGEANGLEGLQELERWDELEPHVRGVRALHVPETGVIDFRAVARAYADDVRARGGELLLGRRLRAAEEAPADRVVVCAGLQADRLAPRTDRAVVPFRGDYFVLAPAAAGLVRALVYPVPDPTFPFLGVHFTRRIDGQVWAGPNAVLAFRRTGYRRRDVSLRDLAEAIGNPGFRKLARRFWRTGAAEMWRDWSKAAFVKEMQRFIPDLRGDQVTFGPSGVRAQALGRDGTLVDDFDLAGGDRVLHVRNAPSPAATSSLAIGARLATEVIERFAL